MNQLSMMRELEDLKAELKAQGEILDAIAKNIGDTGNCWMNAADIDWHGRMEAFASDDENHAAIIRPAWKEMRGHGITLYCGGGFWAAYYDDAEVVLMEAEDDLPMVYVPRKPARTVIHSLHLAAWLEHFAEMHLPVSVASVETIQEE